jgi:ubiquinone/menaquinone biosynthesis C-methylase UbiE
MHVLEHIGLGRYGDPIDPQADLKAIVELKRVLTPGGYLLLVMPIGRPKVMFNARRVYSYQQIISYFYPFQLVQFSLIPDDPKLGDLIEDAPKEFVNTQKNACGCFLFRK